MKRIKTFKKILLLTFFFCFFISINSFATWRKVGNHWRWEESGHYVTNQWRFLNNGVSHRYYYFNNNGDALTGFQRLPDGFWYYFDSTGAAVENRTINIGGKIYQVYDHGRVDTYTEVTGPAITIVYSDASPIAGIAPYANPNEMRMYTSTNGSTNFSGTNNQAMYIYYPIPIFTGGNSSIINEILPANLEKIFREKLKQNCFYVEQSMKLCYVNVTAYHEPLKNLITLYYRSDLPSVAPDLNIFVRTDTLECWGLFTYEY